MLLVFRQIFEREGLRWKEKNVFFSEIIYVFWSIEMRIEFFKQESQIDELDCQKLGGWKN